MRRNPAIMRAPAPRSADVAVEDRGICVDTTVAEEGPVAAGAFDELRIALGDEHLRLGAGFGDDAPEGIAHERVPEELDAVGSRLVLVADAVRRGDVDPVRDGMRPLRGSPRLDLRRPPLGLLGRMPADRRGIEEDLRAHQARDPCGLRVPLVPADQHTDGREAGLEHAEAARLADALAMVVASRIAG